MDMTRWFRVLVMGGAVLGGGMACEAEKDPPVEGPPPGVDAAMSAPDATLGGDGGNPLQDSCAGDDPRGLRFCSSDPADESCETRADGSRSVKAGLCCCWSTSC
jgi:hypothetical protein